MRHLVAPMLDRLQLFDSRLNVLHVLQDRLQQLSALRKIVGHLGEHLEESCCSGNQANHMPHIGNSAMLRIDEYFMRHACWSNRMNESTTLISTLIHAIFTGI